MNEQQPLTKRQQRAVDYILEDERLTSDLTDNQARPLIAWATAQAATAAADQTRSDEEVDAALQAIRRALLRVASTAASAHEHDAERLVMLAQHALGQPQSWPADSSTDSHS